jgi:hypothetical protein
MEIKTKLVVFRDRVEVWFLYLDQVVAFWKFDSKKTAIEKIAEWS